MQKCKYLFFADNWTIVQFVQNLFYRLFVLIIENPLQYLGRNLTHCHLQIANFLNHHLFYLFRFLFDLNRASHHQRVHNIHRCNANLEVIVIGIVEHLVNKCLSNGLRRLRLQQSAYLFNYFWFDLSYQQNTFQSLYCWIDSNSFYNSLAAFLGFAFST